jgi:transposase-like protein
MKANTDTTDRLPRTLMEAVRYFSDPEVCVQFVASLRWTDGPECSACGGKEHSYLTTRRIWKCKNRECRKQFSVKVGTIFEDSPIPLDKWLCSIWLIANAKNGISSYELGRSVGLSQKSAWFVLHRIRLAMQIGNFDRFNGEVETDETFVGGAGKFMHQHKKREKMNGPTGGGWGHKAVIVGTVQRSTDDQKSRVRAEVVERRTNEAVRNHVRDTTEPGSTLYTDEYGAYIALASEGYDHHTINHMAHYVRGNVHTNSIENFWTLLKRGLKGTYVRVDADHLFRYLDERMFTFNEREKNDLGRFVTVLAAVSGRRLTWADLTS